jgi:hypothetical protein
MANSSRPTGNFKDKVEGAASTAAQAATEVKDRAREAGQATVHNLQEGAEAAMHRAGEALTSAKHKASDVASQLGEKAEHAVSSVGERMSSLASTLRESGPREGALGSATSAVARGLETGGHYLQKQSLTDMFDDVQGLIRRFPVQAVLVGVGIGFLMARATRRE